MSESLEFVLVLGILLSSTESNPITNTNFNEHIREFSLKDNNSTNAEAMHKEGLARYANFAQNNPQSIKFSDNAIAASSYSKGFSHHEHPGHGVYDHEETPYYYGQEYHRPVEHDIHGFEHSYHEAHGHANYGHHVGHYHQSLAAKAVLWPLAGIALLGAAAALVSNPILLQLGVATGKRRRRDADTEIDTALDWLQNTPEMCVEESSVETKSSQPSQMPSKRVKKKREKTN
ncbi:uncharacterized protein LOC123689288 [Pieris rapae]|uniref:uncharacterized protein LOC123689288 n=1 Tax=Pieris rapae TaxID=64459 RepID=UPI001E280ACD|nr:uncharacterized protein LOC123689288 [Pieris rapae]